MFTNQHLVDVETILEDGAAAITADRNGQVSSADVILDMHGGANNIGTPPLAPSLVADLVVDISAVDFASNNETYYLILQGSSSPTFASDIANLAIIELADATALLGGADVETGVSRIRIPVCNERDGVHYRYLRLRIDVGGTTPSLTCTARLTQRKW